MTDTLGAPPQGIADLLEGAGYSSGDPIDNIDVHSGDNSESTASSTYTDVLLSETFLRCQWDQIFPSAVTTEAVLYGRVNPGSDQIDVRLRNSTDGETVVETTGITGSTRFVVVGPATYTPTTTAAESNYRIQIRNADNATSVSIEDSMYTIRPIL